MPKTPTAAPLDPSKQDDPPKVEALEQLRAKLERHNKEAEQLAAAMARKPKEI